MARSSGTFKKGNKAAAGPHRITGRADLCTQVLISMLNEVDKNTSREKVWQLMDALWKLAVGYKRTVFRSDGTRITIDVQPDIVAIREVIDRVQGKAPQALQIEAEITNTFSEKPDEQLAVEAQKRGIPERILMADIDDSSTTTTKH